VADRSVSVPITLSDLERRTRGVIFQADLFNNARTDQFRQGRGVFIRGHCSYVAPQGGGAHASATQFGGSLIFMHKPTVTQNYSKFDMVTDVFRCTSAIEPTTGAGS